MGQKFQGRRVQYELLGPKQVVLGVITLLGLFQASLSSGLDRGQHGVRHCKNTDGNASVASGEHQCINLMEDLKLLFIDRLKSKGMDPYLLFLGQPQKNKARGSQNDPRALLRKNYSTVSLHLLD